MDPRGRSCPLAYRYQYEVVPRFVDLEVAVPHLSPAVW
jgi:hypothetical protein